jgi:uncharacterized protein YukE
MKKEFTIQELSLLQHCLFYTGEKEMKDGQEVLSARRLNGEESSQRRHFIKAIKQILEDYDKETGAKVDEHNKLVKEVRAEVEKVHPQKEGEVAEEHQKVVDDMVANDERLKTSGEQLREDIAELNKKSYEIELTEKTLEVLKTYFNEYGQDNGWTPADDDAVSSVEEKLG